MILYKNIQANIEEYGSPISSLIITFQRTCPIKNFQLSCHGTRSSRFDAEFWCERLQRQILNRKILFELDRKRKTCVKIMSYLKRFGPKISTHGHSDEQYVMMIKHIPLKLHSQSPLRPVWTGGPENQ